MLFIEQRQQWIIAIGCVLSMSFQGIAAIIYRAKRGNGPETV